MNISIPYNPLTGEISGFPVVERRLSQLRDAFLDQQAYQAALREGDPLVYRVTSVEPASGDGQLHYALGLIYPGQVGSEYYLTRGHIHAWRAAAEVYLCLSGEGLMLLEGEDGRCLSAQMTANSAVYVPGHTAHRTVNTGRQPLVYWGIYPSAAGHDYEYALQRGFQQVVVERSGRPAVIQRSEFQTL